MAMTNVNIRTDSEIKAKAQQIFESLGLDMSTAINIFLRQTVRQNDLPFVLTAHPHKPEEKQLVRPPFQFGGLTGKIWVADDFDSPLEDMRDYME